MASKRALTAANLEPLGARCLAELLVEIAKGDTATQRRLRLELTAREGPEAIAAKVRQRLTQIAQTRSSVDRHKHRDLVADLQAQRRAIVNQVVLWNATEALELMWRFMDLASPVLKRCKDRSGLVLGVFRDACSDLGLLTLLARSDPVALADRVFAALHENAYGQFDRLIEALRSALGSEGLAHLRGRYIEQLKTLLNRPNPEIRRVVGLSPGDPLYADEFEAHSREFPIRVALAEIADAQGDVDAYIEQFDGTERRVPRIAAGIARRLLAANRLDEALRTIEAGNPGSGGTSDLQWEDAQIEVLEALGRFDDAQAARWSCFERALSAEHLRAYLRRLPDFDDVEAERRALDHAERDQSPSWALKFLVSWPALDRAARLVTAQAAKLDGYPDRILALAADALADQHPLAATLLLRAMIASRLHRTGARGHRHAARHFMACERLAAAIQNFGGFETHADYAARLKSKHGGTPGFWSLLS